MEFVDALKYNFHVSNNELEYDALLVGLCMVLAMNMDQLIIYEDSQIIYGHITGVFEAKEDNMEKYFGLAKALISRFKPHSFKRLAEEINKKQTNFPKPYPRTRSLEHGWNS